MKNIGVHGTCKPESIGHVIVTDVLTPQKYKDYEI